MLLYSWDEGLDVCVDLTGLSPLTLTGMIDFVPSHVVIEVAQGKRVKYEARCANIGYGFLPFSLSSFGELEKDALEEWGLDSISTSIELMNAVAKINDPQCELLLLHSCTGFGDWQWRLATLPFAFGGLGVYFAGDVLNYAFLASRLQSAELQTKLLRHTDIVAFGPNFDDALCVFNTSMETDFLSNLSIPLFSVSKPCSTFSRVFVGDIYGDHAVSCASMIGIKHRHNIVRDTLVDICYRSGISAGKEVDIGLDEGSDKPLRPANMLLYSWDGGLDVCVDLTGSSPLTQTRMTDFIPGRVMIDAAQRKRGKYIDKCTAIGYGFLPFSFSSLGELEADTVILLKRIQKFSMTQDIRARAAVHIFNRIGFSIAKGVGAHIVSRLPLVTRPGISVVEVPSAFVIVLAAGLNEFPFFMTSYRA
ncbi:hypothetical protein Tco_1505300 [Tanacetum coccineum]